MPEIEKKLNIDFKGNQIFKILPKAIGEIKGEILEEKIKQESPFWGQIKVFIRSMWGWGGVKLEIEVKERERRPTLLLMKGYIAQLATRPLTKKMDAFLKSLSSILKEEFNYELEYTSCAPKFLSFPGFKWTRSDTILVIALFGGTFGISGLFLILLLISGIRINLAIRISEGLFLLFIPIAYYIARKFLRKK